MVQTDTERDREKRRETERDRERQRETEGDSEGQGETGRDRRDRKGQIERDNVSCREKCFSLGRRCTFFALSSVPVSRACYNSTKNCQRYMKVSKRVVEDKTNRRCIIIMYIRHFVYYWNLSSTTTNYNPPILSFSFFTVLIVSNSKLIRYLLWFGGYDSYVFHWYSEFDVLKHNLVQLFVYCENK